MSESVLHTLLLRDGSVIFLGLGKFSVGCGKGATFPFWSDNLHVIIYVLIVYRGSVCLELGLGWSWIVCVPMSLCWTICFIGRGRMWMEWKVPLLTDFTEQLCDPLISGTSGTHTHTHLKSHYQRRSLFPRAAADISLARKPRHSWWGRLKSDNFNSSPSLLSARLSCRKVKVPAPTFEAASRSEERVNQLFLSPS